MNLVSLSFHFQGYCGSCWAFSATEQLESDAMRSLGSSYILSAEQTNQCTPYKFGGGCGGGYTESAYNYIKSSGGLVQDQDYPYTAVSAVQSWPSFRLGMCC